MMLKNLTFLVIVSTLTACGANWQFTVSKTVIDPKAKTCSFDVEFPTDYAGGERGKQAFTVTPMTAVEKQYFDIGSKMLYGAGDKLRYKCTQYLGGS